MFLSNVTSHVLRFLKKIVCSTAIGASLIKTINSLLSSFAQCSVRSLFHSSFCTKLVPGFDVRYCPSVAASCLSRSASHGSEKFPERKKTLLFAASCSLHTSACALAASLDSSWFAGQYPDGRFITSNKSLAPCEHLRGISDHVASLSFRRGSSNYLWILDFTIVSAEFRYVIFGAFASRKQRYLRYVRLSVHMCSGESYRAGFREISNLGLCWLKAYGNNEGLRSRMISRHDWSS